jgi:choline dehydrogenase
MNCSIQVLLDKDNKAYGVEYIRHEGVHTARARMEVILSAGSINSPKILLLSGIGPKEHLKSKRVLLNHNKNDN